MTDPDVEDLEVDLLLQVLRDRFGYDFSRYARASIVRRIKGFAQTARRRHISDLIPAVLHETAFLDRLINGLSVRVTEPFRDPAGLRAIVEHVFPWLRSHAFAKVWVAGCSTGEEVYSLAVLLDEAELLGRIHLYATDINTESLARARDGVFPLPLLEAAESNYRLAGGLGNLKDFYTVQYGRGKFLARLTKQVVFSPHNLTCDASFGVMQLVICRNVLIYFDQELQDQVVTLFANSLTHRGFMALGAKESVDRLGAGRRFEAVDRDARLFRTH